MEYATVACDGGHFSRLAREVAINVARRRDHCKLRERLRFEPETTQQATTESRQGSINQIHYCLRQRLN